MPSKKRKRKDTGDGPVALWDFTFFPKEMPRDEFVKQLQRYFKKWIFQLEACPTTGNHHFQGRGSLFKKKRFGELISLLNEGPLRGMDVSESSNNSKFFANFYCLKEDSKLDGPWSDRDAPPVYVSKQYDGYAERLFPWQQKVRDSAQIFDARTINYVCDPTGNKGKSVVTAIMALFDKSIRLPPINDAQLLLATVCDILTGKGEHKPGPIFIDLPRFMKKDKLHGIFSAIEEIKNGHVYDLRYSYKEWWFDSPQVWVFANIDAPIEAMSMDRWRLWNIQDKELVPVVPPS